MMAKEKEERKEEEVKKETEVIDEGIGTPADANEVKAEKVTDQGCCNTPVSPIR